MTDISEVLSALKRGNMTIEEVTNELNESLITVKKGLNDLEKPIEEVIEFERRQKDEIVKYESSNLTLSQEISTLKEEKASNENLLKETQDKYTESTDKRTRLETKKRDTMTELSNIEKKLETAKSEYEMEKETNLKITAELTSLIQAAGQKINEIEKQAESERDLIQRTKGERMALEYLVKRNHIEFNELKIINSLEGRKSTDMVTISKVTGLSDSLILKTLDGLMRRNLLTYDNSTGAITVTGNLKL
jgi:DNA repair exonuclease SbcCD ATPase subunit